MAETVKSTIFAKNMYDQAKSCIKLNGNCSQFLKLMSESGKARTYLIRIFFNDLTVFLQKTFNGLDHISDLDFYFLLLSVYCINI